MGQLRKTAVVDAALLQAALEGLELQRSRLEEQIKEVRRRLGGRPAKASAERQPAAAPAKRALSPAARKRIAAAQKKRWADFRKKKATQG